MIILQAVLILGGTALVFAIFIAAANKKLKVWEDPRIDVVSAMLPNANCGACGLPGCRAFAEKAVVGEIQPSKCTVSNAERIGEINDLVINEAGDVAAVIVGVGGFLGVGEKNVAVDYAELEWAIADDNTERLVLGVNKEALNAAPAVELLDDQAAGKMAQARPVPAADKMADPTQTGSVSTQPGAAAAPSTFDRSTLNDLDELTLTAEELIGTDVYGPNDEHVGTIGDFVLAEDGKAIDAIIVDVGGFLGMGAKEVAIGFENLDFAADANNNRYLLLNVTKAQLEEQAAFNRDTYANERDTQRLILQAS